MTITKEGSLASFYTVNKAPIKHLRVYFSPQQEGTGDPSPSNVREIGGQSGLTTWYTNKNLFPSTDYSYHGSGIIVSRTAGKISITGTSSGAFYRAVTDFWTTDGSSVVLYNVPVLTNGAYWFVWNGSNNIISGSNINGIPFQPVSGLKIQLALAIGYANVTTNVEFTPIMCKTSDLSIIPVDWSSTIGTVYGGYVDLITGELVQEYNYYQFTGNETFYDQGNTWVTVFIPNIETNSSAASNPAIGICSHYPYRPYNRGKIGVMYDEKGCTFDGNIKNNTEWQQYCAEQYALNTPVTICYKLKTPITYQLTPTQLQTLIGRNNIWSNADRVEVEYDLAESNDELYRRRNIILRGYPHIETASGAIANFSTDLTASLKECRMNFLPTQEGSGDPSPENVREIGGWNEVEVTRSGKNLLQASALFPNGSYYQINNDTITIPQTDSGNWSGRNQYKIKKGTYTFSRSNGYGRWYYIIDPSTTQNTLMSIGMTTRTITFNEDCIIRFKLGNLADSYPFTTTIQSEVGDIASTIEPYVGQTISLNWSSTAGTIYGGYVDLINKEVVNTYQRVIISSPWSYAGNNNYCGTEATNFGFSITKSPIANPSIANCYSNKFTYSNKGTWSDPNNNQWKFCINAYNQLHVVFNNQTVGITSDMDYLARKAVIESWLQNNICEFIIPLFTPIHYSITSQTLKTLKGTNNIWSNANGPIEIKYWTH